MNIAAGLSHRNTRNSVALILYGAGAVVGIVAYWRFMTDPAIPVPQTTVALVGSLLLFITAPIIRRVEKWHLIAISFLMQIVAVSFTPSWRMEEGITFSFSHAKELLQWESLAFLTISAGVLCVLSLPLAMLTHRMIRTRSTTSLLNLYFAISWILVVSAFLFLRFVQSTMVA